MKYYKMGGETEDIFSRAERVTGRNMGKLRNAGLDTSKLSNLTDDQIKSLYNLVVKYKSDFQPSEKGNIGEVISKAKQNLPRIREDMASVGEMTGLSKDDMKQIAYGLVDQSDKMGYLTKKGVNAAISSLLKRGGRIGC